MYSALMLACAAVTADGTTTSVEDVGPLSVRVEAPRRIALSHKLVLSVTVSAPETVSVQPPPWKPGETFSGMPILAVKVQGPDRIVGKFATLTVQNWNVELEPLRPGRVELGRLPLAWRAGGEPAASGGVTLPTVEVLSGQTSSDDPSTLREPDALAKQEAVKRVLPRLLVVAGVGLLIGVGLLWFAMTPLRRVSEKDRAVAAIAALEAKTDSAPRATLDEACAILRQYVGTRYQLRVEASTAREFLTAPATIAALNGVRAAAFADFLESADLDRFPEREPDVAAAERCLRRARAFLAEEPPR